jgi:hypothetical protein
MGTSRKPSPEELKVIVSNKWPSPEELQAQEEKYGRDGAIFYRMYAAAKDSRLWSLYIPSRFGNQGYEFWRSHWRALASVLTSSGVQASTSEAVLNDYQDVLTGSYRLSATPEQMQEVMDKCDALAIYEVDSVGAYYALYFLYKSRLSLCKEYEKKVAASSPTATQDTRHAFFKENYSGTGAMNLIWLLSQDKINFEDLADERTCGEESPRALFFRSYNMVGAGAYLLFYVVARYALKATEEEAREIDVPYTVYVGNAFRDEAEAIASQIVRQIEEDGNSLRRSKAQAEEEARQKAQAEALECAGVEYYRYSRKMIGVINQYGALMASRTGEPEDNSFIYDLFVAEMKASNEDLAKLTYFTGGRGLMVLDGINKMLNNERKKLDGSRYVFNVRATGFARYCGSVRPNGDEIRSNYETLKLFNILFFEVRKPGFPFEVEVNGKKTKHRAKDTVEKRPLILLTNMKGETDPELRIEIAKDLIDGSGYTYMLREAYERAQSMSSGESFRIFLFQVIEKDHKNEEDLRKIVFGYGAKIRQVEEEEEGKRATLRELINKSPDLKAGGLKANEPIERQSAKVMAAIEKWKANEGRQDEENKAERKQWLIQSAKAVAELRVLAKEKKEAELQANKYAKRDRRTLDKYFAIAKKCGLILSWEPEPEKQEEANGSFAYKWTKPNPRITLATQNKKQLPDAKK